MRRLILFFFCPILWVNACSKVEDQAATPPKASLPPVAQISMDGGGFDLRMPGEVVFKPHTGRISLCRGSTIRSRQGLITLNFLGSVPVQLGEQGVSEVILEGPVETDRGKEIVLGLKQGDIRVNSEADYPLVLKMPHAEVRGLKSYIQVWGLKRNEYGGYRANVKSLSTNEVLVSNAHGSINLSYFGVVRVDDQSPPALLKKETPRPRIR
jgi:hypothetical protein